MAENFDGRRWLEETVAENFDGVGWRRRGGWVGGGGGGVIKSQSRRELRNK